LPDVDSKYLEEVLSDVTKLPPKHEVAARVQITNTQREAHKLWTIAPCDMSEQELVEQRRRKDRERKMRQRRRKGVLSRDAYLERAKKPLLVSGTDPTLVSGTDRVSARISYRSGHTLPPHQDVPQQMGIQGVPDSWPDVDLHGRSV